MEKKISRLREESFRRMNATADYFYFYNFNKNIYLVAVYFGNDDKRAYLGTCRDEKEAKKKVEILNLIERI